MRWLFADPNNAEEAAHLCQKVAAIDHWWQAFQNKQTQLENRVNSKSSWNLPKFMEEQLQAIEPALMWEFGPAIKQPGHRLVITPESQRHLRPMVRTILERAPKIPGWEFYPYRLPETAEHAIQTIKGRTRLDIAGALIDVSAGPGRKIDLRFAFPLKTKLDADDAMQAAFVATETLMGEQILDTWIGAIDLLDRESEPEARPLPLDRAQATAAALIRGLYDQLPDSRATDISVEVGWSTVQLDPPEEADDYPDRGDLIVAVTHDVELCQAMHGGLPFSSACHSKIREQFCYLKIDATDLDSERIAALRARFEEGLNFALLAAEVGGCIGGGTGLRYAYIDLALTDLKRAIPLLRNTLIEQKAPLRSWLLFHDDDLAAEWVGIYPQTPPPPT